MFEGHDPYLVALSVVIAILGGYTGFGLAARIRGTPGVSHRVLLAGAAGFLAVGIWTMHFVGMLAAPIPPDAVYLVLPTIVSFLICALVVGVSLFFLSIGEPSQRRVISSAVLLGAGIASMHYVGIHGLAGNFAIVHDAPMMLLSILIAIMAAYGGLRVFLARQDGIRLIASSIAFGIAVSGMHYTAMYGMHFVPLSETAHHHMAGGLAASPQILSVAVAGLLVMDRLAAITPADVQRIAQSYLVPARRVVGVSSSSNKAAARSMISRCPEVTGSKVPGTIPRFTLTPLPLRRRRCRPPWFRSPADTWPCRAGRRIPP